MHQRLAPGLVTDVRLRGDTREVVFASGLVIEELIVSVDDGLRRLAYTVLNRSKHHHASMQIIAEAENHCRFIWITDVTPHDVTLRFSTVMDQALPVIQRTLTSASL